MFFSLKEILTRLSRSGKAAPQSPQGLSLLLSFFSAISMQLLPLRLLCVPKQLLELQPSSLHSRQEEKRIRMKRRGDALENVHPS